MTSLEDLKLGIQPRDYTELLSEAVESINSSASALKIRGINDPAYILLGTYLYLAQLTLEQFSLLTSGLALNLIEAKGITEFLSAPAEGEVLLTLPVSAVASASTLASPSGVTYAQITPPILVPADTPTPIKYRAIFEGTVTNSPDVGNLLAQGWYSSLPATDVVTATGFIGGRNTETSETFLTRGRLSLGQQQAPVSQQDWQNLAVAALSAADNSTRPFCRVQNQWRTEQLPRIDVEMEGGIFISCPNQVTRPEIRIYLARQYNQTATEPELAAVRASLETRRPVHTELVVAALPVLPISAKVILEVTGSIPGTDILQNCVAAIQENLETTESFIQHRVLLSSLSRLTTVKVAEEIWIAKPDVMLKPDNVHIGLVLPYLKNLELVLITPGNSQTLYYAN